jgi:hypothetical protein
MKYMSLLALIVLVGCASRPTIDELEDEAAKTGDWSAVENRKRMIQRMRLSQDLKCPAHLMPSCIENRGYKDCACRPVLDPSSVSLPMPEPSEVAVENEDPE